MGILIQSTPALSEGLFFEEKVASQLLIDLEYQKKVVTHQEEQIDVISKQNINLFNLSEQYKLKSEGLQKDKEIQSKRAQEFQDLYKGTSKDLDKCLESKPSRFTWFGVGFLTAVILGTAAAFAISK